MGLIDGLALALAGAAKGGGQAVADITKADREKQAKMEEETMMAKIKSDIDQNRQAALYKLQSENANADADKAIARSNANSQFRIDEQATIDKNRTDENIRQTLETRDPNEAKMRAIQLKMLMEDSRVPSAVKTVYAGYEKQIEQITGAIAHAKAQSTYDSTGAGAKELQESLKDLYGKQNELYSPYLPASSKAKPVDPKNPYGLNLPPLNKPAETTAAQPTAAQPRQLQIVSNQYGQPDYQATFAKNLGNFEPAVLRELMVKSGKFNR